MVPKANPDWLKRGQACRDLRVKGTPYRTQKEQAEVFGLAMVDLSKMENGRADPTPLESHWGTLAIPAAYSCSPLTEIPEEFWHESDDDRACPECFGGGQVPDDGTNCGECETCSGTGQLDI